MLSCDTAGVIVAFIEAQIMAASLAFGLEAIHCNKDLLKRSVEGGSANSLVEDLLGLLRFPMAEKPARLRRNHGFCGFERYGQSHMIAFFSSDCEEYHFLQIKHLRKLKETGADADVLKGPSESVRDRLWPPCRVLIKRRFHLEQF